MPENFNFTTTEHQLLHSLSAGASNKAIARHLGKSEYTVRNQLSGVFKKINACNRTQAASWYREYLRQAAPQ
jgi:two-component system, NarL family, nitrate/nitrite response regulator NarL